MNWPRNKIICGDCLEVMQGMPDGCVDSIVTDSPYGLKFMGKKWDCQVPSVEIWQGAFRVLKPGGHLLSFFGTRTYHRGVVNIEDAGFEIRDQIGWLYGSGFPKSLDASKAIDKMIKRCGLLDDFAKHYAIKRKESGLTHNKICEIGNFYENHNHGGASVNWEKGYNVPTLRQWKILKPLLCLSDEWLPLIERIEAFRIRINLKERPVIGKHSNPAASIYGKGLLKDINITAPATDEARQWNGWGTGLKPAWECICLARKPLEGTVAENVLKHGTGVMNIDGSRVEMPDRDKYEEKLRSFKGVAGKVGKASWKNKSRLNDPEISIQNSKLGRWPANIIHDGSEEVLAGFPESKGQQGDVRGTEPSRTGAGDANCYGEYGRVAAAKRNDSGSAARFFYCAKASKSERNKGLDSTCTVKYIVDKSQLKGGIKCQDATMELVELLKKVTSESTVKWLIGESGESIMGLCQRDFLFTTLTEIRKITTSKILPLLTPSLINAFIPGVNCEMGNGGNPAVSVDRSSRLKPIITKGSQVVSALGVKRVVSEMLLTISAAANWKPLSNTHSTVKPVALMRYLCRLVTPPGGIILDLFAGSGTTGIAAVLEGFDFVCIDKDAEICEIARKRVAQAQEQPDLFRKSEETKQENLL